MKLEIELFNKVIANKDYSENSKKIINKSVKYKNGYTESFELAL